MDLVMNMKNARSGNVVVNDTLNQDHGFGYQHEEHSGHQFVSEPTIHFFRSDLATSLTKDRAVKMRSYTSKFNNQESKHKRKQT